MEDNQEKQRKLLHDRGICVVIPTYNNGGTIAMVVRETLKEISDVIVVNDGSTDDTSKILHSIEGIAIVEYTKNRGKGYALRKGFECALEMGFSYAITLDGDGQHYPSDIALFLKENQKHPGALIIGSRQLIEFSVRKAVVLPISSLTFGFTYKQVVDWLTRKQVIACIH